MTQTVIYSPAKIIKLSLLICVLMSLSAIFLGSKPVSALGDNFPQGNSASDEWVLLSQYQCPGHCLDTPKADIRIFYKVSAMTGLPNNFNLEIDVQTLCRYNGTPNGSANLEGGTTNNGWPGITCTGLNTHSGGSDVKKFFVQKDNLQCGQSGNNGRYPGWCYTDLHLRLSSTPGNQPIVGAWIFSADGLGNAKVTAQEQDNPDANYDNTNCYTGAGGSCSPSGGPPNGDHLFALWNNYNNNGPDTHHGWDFTFAADCTVKSSRPAYLRWYDADDSGGGNNGTQSGQLSFSLRDDTTGQYIFPNRTGLGGNDSYRDLGFTIKPNHRYTWKWNNVSATNGIQLWLPASEIGAIIDCPGQPGPGPGTNPIPGTASCNVQTDTSAIYPFVGETVHLQVEFKNESNDTDWWVGGAPFADYDNNGVIDYSNNPINGNEPPGMPAGGTYAHHYPRDPNSLGYPAVVNDKLWRTKQHSGVLLGGGEVNGNNAQALNNGYPAIPSNSSRLAKGQSVVRDFWITNTNAGASSTTYKFGIRNDESGDYFPTSDGNSLCNATINWQLADLNQYGCATTAVYNPGNLNFYLKFFDDSSGGEVHTTGTLNGTNPSWDTFNTWTMLYPHKSYTVVMYQDGSNAELDRDTVPVCLSASCQLSVTGPSSVSEPGETTSLTYGVNLVNYTQRTFPAGTYSAQVRANPGLFMNPDPDTSSSSLAPNGSTTVMAGPWTVRTDYSGSLNAHLLFGSTNIDDIISDTGDCTQPYTPETRPTIQVKGGDISTGGGFGDLNGQCSTANANFVLPRNATSGDYPGGIRTFSNPSASNGSGVDFAAYALGIIDGTGGGPEGFYSDSASGSGANYRNLDFANSAAAGITLSGGSGNLGGVMGGVHTNAAANTNASAHCATDYYNTTRKNTVTTLVTANQNLSTLTTAQYQINGNVLLRATEPINKRITIYVDGNVRINSNINYASWAVDMVNRTVAAPYVTIIARGNISIDSNVTELAGLYIAQQDTAGGRGIFNTCSIAGAVPSSAQIASTCRGNKLLVKGSIIAQHVYPLRAIGTLRDGDVSETVDFVPSIVLGEPNLKPLNDGAVISGGLEGLSSLPPVF